MIIMSIFVHKNFELRVNGYLLYMCTLDALVGYGFELYSI